MAKNPRPTDVETLEDTKPKSDWESIAGHVKENPGLWAAAIAFVVVCALAGTMFRMQRGASLRDVTTEYARAVKETEPAQRVAALLALTESKSVLTAEALYIRGESAIEAQDPEVAAESFQRLREEYPDFAFTPDAVEGLGFLAEDSGDFEVAVGHYQDVMDSWPDSFAARRQPLNTGRAQERAEDWDAAIKAYQRQLAVFPGSNAQRHAQEALNRLREERPELFPEDPGLALATDEQEIPAEIDSFEEIDALEAPLSPEE